MKKQNRTIITACIFLIVFSIIASAFCISVSAAAVLNTTRRTGTTTTTTTTTSNDTSEGTTEPTTESTTESTTKDLGNRTLKSKTTTTKPTSTTKSNNGEDTGTTSDSEETIRGTTKDYNQTGAVVTYDDTTYSENNNYITTDTPTYTTEPTSAPSDDEFESIGSTYNITGSHEIEIYTWYGETTSLEDDTETTQQVEEKTEFKFNPRYLIGVLIILVVGLIVTVVTFIKGNKEFRSSLYFKFNKR